MIQFARKCSRDPKTLPERDYEELRRPGLEQPEVVDLIAMSAFAVYANIIADATGMEADKMFATQARMLREHRLNRAGSTRWAASHRPSPPLPGVHRVAYRARFTQHAG